jgi:hypothetical protein
MMQKTFALVCVCAVLGGCAELPVAGKDINPPPKYLMSEPAAFPVLHNGDNAVSKLAEAAKVHSDTARKVRALQRYIRLIRRD